MLQNVQNRPCPGHQKPGKLNLLKIKYVKFSPRIKISYCKMSEKHVNNTQFCVLWPNRTLGLFMLRSFKYQPDEVMNLVTFLGIK